MENKIEQPRRGQENSRVSKHFKIEIAYSDAIKRMPKRICKYLTSHFFSLLVKCEDPFRPGWMCLWWVEFFV